MSTTSRGPAPTVASREDAPGLVVPAGVVPPPTDRWTSRHLLGLGTLSPGEIRAVLRRARELAPLSASLGPRDDNPDTPWALARREGQRLAGRVVANLFFEDSTRTRTSFTVAARRLGAEVVDLFVIASSVSKGETLIDTAKNVEATGVDALVVRARQAGAAALLADHVRCSVVNAGDGGHEHPTQGLLDAYTIAEAHGRLDAFDLAGLRVAIVGDIVASRVARSNIAGLTRLGAEVVCVGPPALAPRSLEVLGCRVSHDLDEVLPTVDAVMMLRIQFERHGTPAVAPLPGAAPKRSAAIASVREYRTFYGLSEERAERMKPSAVVIHPGPINRGIELDHAVADGPRSVVLRQVRHGVAVRMAALSMCVLASA
ncbi:MAG: aspartate carbamoyltransferase catalytic subunit [Phycisphaerae bacterium]|nr:aspartate carbamoyltransferase catalytic subunit [Phycisphaerae bacterium]